MRVRTLAAPVSTVVIAGLVLAGGAIAGGVAGPATRPAVASTVQGGAAARPVGSDTRPALGPVVTLGHRIRNQVTAEPNAAVTGRYGVTTVAWRQAGGLMVRRRGGNGGWSRAFAVGCRAPGSGRCTSPALAVDGHGTVTAVWQHRRRPGAPSAVEVAWRPRGGHWHGPLRLTGTRFRNGHSPRVTAAWDGAALVTFQVSPGTGTGTGTGQSGQGGVAALYRPAHGSWAHARATVFAHTRRVAAAMADHGAVVAVHTTHRSRGMALVADRYRPGAGWGREVVIARQPVDGSPQVDVAPGGRAVVAWVRGGLTQGSVVRARMMTADGRWLPPRTVSGPSRGAYNMGSSNNQFHGDASSDVVMDAHGVATITWSRDDWPRSLTQMAASKVPHHRWRRTAVAHRRVGVPMVLTANRRGDLAYLWGDRSARIYAALRRHGHHWSRARLVATTHAVDTRGGSQPVVAAGVLPDGAAVVAYTDLPHERARTITPR